ncbi:hypothetical protein [Tessaracoccus sp. Z1128]
MTAEVTGAVRETFESRTSARGFELLGEGRLSSLAVDFLEGWGHPRASADSVGVDVEHEAGVVASVRVRSGQRLRLEISLESTSSDVLTVPGPVLRVRGLHEPVSWMAGASGEIALRSPAGPGLITQRRGLCSPSAAVGVSYPLEESVMLRPRQVLSAAWTYEAMPGEELEVPGEASWLPWSRHVPLGQGVEFSAPDGTVSVPDGVRLEENDGEFSVFPPPGLTRVGVWGAGGLTTVEVGAWRDLAILRGELMTNAPRTDVWAYVAVRHMLDAWASDDLLDAVDRVVGQYQEQPTAWIACAAALAGPLGLPLESEASVSAAAALSRASRLDGVLLALHGLVPIELASGSWPIGDFDDLGRQAFAATGFGRISTDPRPLRGVDVALAKLYAAGLGETERGIRLAAYAQAAENRLLCQLSAQPSVIDVAWLSV